MGTRGAPSPGGLFLDLRDLLIRLRTGLGNSRFQGRRTGLLGHPHGR